MPKIKIKWYAKVVLVLFLVTVVSLPLLVHIVALNSDAFQVAKVYLLNSKNLADLLGERVEVIRLPWWEDFHIEATDNNGDSNKTAFFTLASKGKSREIMIYTTLQYESGVWKVKSAKVKMSGDSQVELVTQ